MNQKANTYSDSPQEECGIFGIYAPGKDVSRMTYFALQALQHRGQESAGIAAGDGQTIVVKKDLGLVTQVFCENDFAALSGFLALGHVRYSTSGASDSWYATHPHMSSIGEEITAVAHNGTLVNTNEMRQVLDSKKIPFQGGAGVDSLAGADGAVATAGGDSQVGAGAGNATAAKSKAAAKKAINKAATDSEIAAKLIGYYTEATHHIRQGIKKTMELIKGAYAMALITRDALYAFRDPHGIRPLCIGKLPDNAGWCVASETCALDIVGAEYVRDCAPGEIVRFSQEGMVSEQGVRQKNKAFCLFEHVYFSRPDSIFDKKTLYTSRVEMGKTLAKQAPVAADLCIGVPDSGIPGAIGFSRQSGIAYAEGIVKNRYVGRTFIQPTQELRNMGIRLKLNPMRAALQGKRIVVIDDSIVRGNTFKQLVLMLREAGAAAVHVRIMSPPVKWPCFYGVDMAVQDKLIAANKNVDEICSFIGADSLAYISLAGLIDSVVTGSELEGAHTAAGGNALEGVFNGEHHGGFASQNDGTHPISAAGSADGEHHADSQGEACGFCTACFSGRYCVAIPEALGKNSFSEGAKPIFLDELEEK